MIKSSPVVPLNYFSNEPKDPFREVISGVSDRYRNAVTENSGRALPDDMINPTIIEDLRKPTRAGHYRKIFTHHKTRPIKDGEITEEPTKFMVMVDVSEFLPEEVHVRTVDTSVIVECKKEKEEEEESEGYVTRHFIRRYTLPDVVDPQMVEASLTTTGHLTVEAAKKEKTGKAVSFGQIPVPIEVKLVP